MTLRTFFSLTAGQGFQNTGANCLSVCPVETGREKKKGRDQLEMFILLMCYLIALILLQLHPVSLMHKNPQRCKIIHSMCPIGRKDQLVDLKMCICRNIPFMFFLVAVTMAVV